MLTNSQDRDILVTIVVTCYNRADMVCTALDSVWNQTYRPLELIVVDDGSKDNSMEVIEDWRVRHPDGNGFSSVAKTFPNGKLCVARNRGLALAHGDYIQYVDDDDWLYPEAITRKMAYASTHPELDLIVNQLDYVRDGRKINHTRISLPQNGENLVAWILEHECLLSAVLMFKKETLRKIGAWKEGLIFADDMEITMRLAILGGQFGMVDEQLSGCRIHAQLRQCATVRDRLPNDFCARLFGDLFYLCSVKECLDNEVVCAFIRQCYRDVRYFVAHGKFGAAKECLLFKVSISYATLWDRFLISKYGILYWKMQYRYVYLLQKTKFIIKKVI